MKKHIINFLLVSLLLNLTTPVAFAQTKLNAILPNRLKQESSGVYVELEDSVISTKLEKELKDEIEKVYGKENTETIYSKIVEIAKIAKQNRPQNLKAEDLSRESDWYKDQIIYMFYVDQFGTVTPEKPNKFNDTVGMLGYLKKLGVTTIYMLPFADSPMEDAGFDVKNPQNVRHDLGGKPQFENFIKQAKEQGFNIKADLVLNHFSDQHEWFQQALKGDEEKVERFVARETMPEYTRYVDEKLGTVAEYKEDNGEISKRRIIFPEITEHNWRKETINGKDRYFYHTFYPFQIDINWENPEVLYYNLETINYWANLGVDIFRLDAIPYLIKEPGTNAENLPKTHSLIKILSIYLQAVAPRSVLQAEACQLPKDVIPYFGDERKTETIIDGQEKSLKRTDEVQIAYNFPYGQVLSLKTVSILKMR